MKELADVSCIVVHHKNYPGVLASLELLLLAGIKSENLVIVDNSEDEEIRRNLISAAGLQARLAFIANKGYANAVNYGASCLANSGCLRRYTLVATHEVAPRSDAVFHLRNALVDQDRAIVAGPTLVIQTERGEELWSTGGYLSRWLNVPRHFHSGDSLADAAGMPVTMRDWLDGAFCLYNSDYLLQYPMNEGFFLYFEETDYHSCIRERSGEVLWCPQAVVAQASSGIPPYLLGRNMQLFQDAHGNRLQAIFTVPCILIQKTIRFFQGRFKFRDVSALARGWIAGLQDHQGGRKQRCTDVIFSVASDNEGSS